MQVKNQYDLIVVGDQLSGLLLAAGAAQSGKRVLVLEGSPSSTVLYEVPSGKFLGDLVAEPVLGLHEGSKADNFLKNVGLYQSLSDIFPLHENPLQVLHSNYRLDFSYELEALKENAKREWDMPAEIQDKFCRLLTGNIVSKKDISQLVSEIPLGVEWEPLCFLQSALFGAASPESFPYHAYKELVKLASHGVRFSLGGRSAIKERLLSRVLIYGGSVKRGTWVEEIVFEKKRLAGVLLSSYEGFVRSPMVIGAMGANTFLSLIPNDLKQKNLVNRFAKIHPKFWRLSFTILVPEDLIPEGMGSHLAYVPENRSLSEDNFLQVQTFAKEVYGGIPIAHKALVVRVLVPHEEESLQPKAISRILKRSMQNLEKIIPFIAGKNLSISPDPNNLEQDSVYQKYFHFKSLEHIPPSLLVYDSSLSVDFDNREYMDWSKYGLDGLAICSRDIRPLLGLTGEVFSAMDLLQIIQSKESRRKR